MLELGPRPVPGLPEHAQGAYFAFIVSTGLTALRLFIVFLGLEDRLPLPDRVFFLVFKGLLLGHLKCLATLLWLIWYLIQKSIDHFFRRGLIRCIDGNRDGNPEEVVL